MPEAVDAAAVEGVAMFFFGEDEEDDGEVLFQTHSFALGCADDRSLQAGSFSFREFYFRRARRILPAALPSPSTSTGPARWAGGQSRIPGSSTSTASAEAVPGAHTTTPAATAAGASTRTRIVMVTR